MASSWRWKIAQFAERNWWKNYLRNQNVANYLEWKKEYWHTQIAKLHLDIQAQHVLLDAGCGPAGVFIIYPNNNLTACDPLLDAYDADLPHFKKANYPNVTFVNSGLEDFKSNQLYDYIFCMNAINHVQNLPLAYDVLVANLKPNGTLIISIDAHNYSLFRKIFALLPGDVLHPHQYNLQEYKAFLSSRNCTIEQAHLIKKEFLFNHYVLVATKKG